LSKKGQASQPPQPPEIEKRLAFYPEQLIGIPLLMLLPILALLGVFGEGYAEASSSSDVLAITVEYPTRNRYGMNNFIEVKVQNVTEREVASVTVSFNADYIGRFAEVTFQPEVDEVANGAYHVTLNDVEPEETRLVTVELKGDQYGRHNGQIMVSAEGAREVEIPIDTFIFP
jgi:hypothetical protein